MRVLFCTDTYPPQVNGVSIVTALMVSGLSRRGWQCAVVAPRYPAATRAQLGGQPAPNEGPAELVTIPSVPMPRYPEVRLALPWIGSVRRMVERFRPDLVHCATEFSIGRIGQSAAARSGLPNSPPRSLCQLRRVRLRIGLGDTGPGGARGHGERAPGRRRTGRGGARPSDKRGERADVPGGRRWKHGSRDGGARDRT